MQPLPELRSKFRNTVRRHDMFDDCDAVIVTVSGGPDSVALLHLLLEVRAEKGLKLEIAHFDHRLRGPESEADAFFVRDLSEKAGLPFHLAQGNVAALKKRDGLSTEEACRELRYDFFRGLAESIGAQKIALGHTADDQAEEILLRLTRGAGPNGLSGIPYVRNGVFVRPLLDSSRKDILAYLSMQGLKYRMDRSNESKEFLRNRVRHDLLPILERDFNPRIRELLVRTASIFREDESYLNQLVDKAWIEIAKVKNAGESGQSVLLDVGLFRKLPTPIRMRIVKKAFEAAGATMKEIGYRHLESAHGLADKEGGYKVISIPGNVSVEKIYKELRFCKKPLSRFGVFRFQVNGPGRYWVSDIGRFVTLEITNPLMSSTSHSLFHFDSSRIIFPLTLRNSCPGDRIRLERNGRQKLKDFFINLKIPQPMRSSIPLLEQGGEIIGIPGLYVQEDFKVSETTKQVLGIILD